MTETDDLHLVSQLPVLGTTVTWLPCWAALLMHMAL